MDATQIKILVLSDEPLGPLLNKHLTGYNPILRRPRNLDDACQGLALMELAIVTYHYSEGGGLNACRRLLQADPELPVIVFTQSTRLFDMQATFQAGAHDCIPMPVEGEILRKSVDNALTKRTRRRQMAGIADDMQRTVEQNRQHILRMEDGAVRLCLGILKCRCPQVEAHSRHAMRLAERFAAFLGWTSERQRQCQVAGALHDLGFIGLSDRLARQKPGNMQEEILYRQHPSIGRQLTAEVIDDPFILEAIEFHHEHWDGTGFPKKLMGKRIPEAARFLSAVNTFSMLLFPPVEGSPLSIEDAMLRLMPESGTRCDPEMIDAFTRFVSESQPERLK